MPKEELSLDVIKQYTVVRAHVLHSSTWAALDPRTACVSWHTYAWYECVSSSTICGTRQLLAMRMLHVLSAALPDAGRQDSCADGHDIPALREAGPDYHLCAHTRHRAPPAPTCKALVHVASCVCMATLWVPARICWTPVASFSVGTRSACSSKARVTSAHPSKATWRRMTATVLWRNSGLALPRSSLPRMSWLGALTSPRCAR